MTGRTAAIDTGCVFDGQLTASRYPELELVAVPAARSYCEPMRQIVPASTGPSAQQAADMVLGTEDASGKRTITTSPMGHMRIEAENAAAALEVMSRFAVDPRSSTPS